MIDDDDDGGGGAGGGAGGGGGGETTAATATAMMGIWYYHWTNLILTTKTGILKQQKWGGRSDIPSVITYLLDPVGWKGGSTPL